MRSSFIALTSCLISSTLAAPGTPIEKRDLLAAPTVQISSATVVGSSLLGVDSFKGIPYAQPPVGPLRLKPPQRITQNLGTIQATGSPQACPQFFTSTNTSALPNDLATEVLDLPVVQGAANFGEDCLTMNVQRPSTANATSKLPVLFWIYGGAFEFGSTSMYDASTFISNAAAQGKEFVYVSVNHRLGGFGFLPGKEVLKDGSANLGLLDQRLGLQWTADNIAAFGGDPEKVTIWGESAGSIAVFDQMALYNGDNTYKGKPLFRSAIMDSGSVVPADPVDCPKGQTVYDTVVFNAGCSGASDTLACLRSLPYETYLKATTSVPAFSDYQSVALSYLPRPDGVVLTKSPEFLAEHGIFAQVPFIIGDQEDEGTLFSLSQSNISTTDELVTYFSTIFFHDATIEQVQALVDVYPDDPSQGSPFGTGPLNNIYPQYKRLAAILGDATFTLTRRVFLTTTNQVYPSLPTYSYLATYGYGTPVLGTFHASDILRAYGEVQDLPAQTIMDYYSSFLYHGDPNVGLSSSTLPTWPIWSAGQQLLNFGEATNSLIPDDFREKQFQFFLANATNFHV